MKVCSHPDCPTLTRSNRCPTHARERDRARGSRQARGYDTTYDRERRRWTPLVRQGLVDCHAPTCLEPSRRLPANAPFDLGHTPDRAALTGPEHPRCNRSAGGHASHT